MNYNEELARLTESVSLLQRKIEYMLRDRGLQRDIEFEKKLNELLDSFGCPIELLLEVVVARTDIPAAIRSKLADIADLDFGFSLEPDVGTEVLTATGESSIRPAGENALEWKEKFGHRSLESWFQ
ncbi:hypothetical protein YA0059_24960 [Pseudomonas syringae]|uniref:hypothetical protein n=1 Tax=Pseudomonas syringae TaxID=317 RepID=UPI0018E5BC53|nr:hypothetical protein [Pseudomonas syringae]MBI6766693.1 hypothetical protein [Pseudomonas syringae]MBI6788935.1 hypothetical protein [Pseudomonas syringae]